jgi:Tol biopolymer transport system component
VHASSDGKLAVFVGTIASDLDGTFITQICAIDLESGYIRVLSSGSSSDRSPKFSPSGRQVAFLSDRHASGDFQLYFFDFTTTAIRSAPRVEGWVEYIHWSPDGAQILLGVAGHGADVSSGQGAITSKVTTAVAPSWAPEVQTGDEERRWRHAWVYDIGADKVRGVPAKGNIWEAVWCGGEFLAAIVSPGPSEGMWYTARLHILDVNSGESREIYKPKSQLGLPAASPSGRRLAIVEAICSDRLIVAGNLHVADTESGQVFRMDTQQVDITYVEWRSEEVLLLAGHQGFETVVGLYDVNSHAFTKL